MPSLRSYLHQFVHAEDWPRWRGPNNDNKSPETGLLTEWPEGGPKKDWQVGGLGTGYSSVAVAQGKIFTLGRNDNVEYLFALKQSDGSQLWSTRLGAGTKEKGPNGTPTVDGNRVYAVSFEGDLVCADVESGREIWRKNFQRDFNGKMMSMWGYSESPLIDGDRLICTPGGPNAMVVALNKLDGKLIWRAKVPSAQKGNDGAGYSSIVISNAGGVKQYVQMIGHGVISLAAEDGRFLRGYAKIANTTANVPSPIVSGNYIFASTGYSDGGSALLEISGSRGRLTPREVYYKNAKTLQNHHGGMILLDGKIYMGHGHNNGFPCCIDLRSGNPVWGPQRGPGTESAAITYADGHLYFRYQDGTMTLIEASEDGFKLKGKFEEDFNWGPRWAHPVVSGGKLYLRTNHELACFNLK
ncbi:MAG: PQQ-like beta-propeller repeat protein [Planctomicrobium sp.]|nr:PQQ-like beta-propeller repeat protein [Planctomicrobium sp.]